MILFPLGSPIFSNLGSAGISIFYVSTIVSQLVFSFGSVFKGGIGSELVSVVPYHLLKPPTLKHPLPQFPPKPLFFEALANATSP